MHKANDCCGDEDIRQREIVGLVVTSERIATRLTTPKAIVRLHIIIVMAETKKRAAEANSMLS